MNLIPSSTEPLADAIAVQAIRAGDRDRYRELVERHADKVFAIAWCRLGDRDLAEEAAQEAFISGYRRLALLGHAEKFGAWISAIARNASINLGLRRRGELRKRARWALEQEPSTAAGCDDPGATRETLRATLEGLPPIHRECLVLFYLENQSIAEAAETLGISENAFKVRLHRARAVLREALEVRLEADLVQLRAPSRLTHAVMLALPAHSSGLLALGGIASGLAKAIPFSFVMLALQIVSAIPGLLLARWMGHKELANFRDPAGFRSRLYRRFLRGVTIAVGLMFVSVYLATAGLGLRTYSTLFGAFFVLSGLDMVRKLHVVRNVGFLAGTVGVLILAIPLLGMGLWNWNVTVLLLAQGAFFGIMSFAVPRFVPRMDYSLFTRAAHGLFLQSKTAPSSSASGPFSHQETLEFARFLGQRMLIDDWRRTSDGIELRLVRAVPHVLATTLPFYWGPTSGLILRHDGRVEARLGEVDRRELSLSQSAELPSSSTLETRVATALKDCRTAFHRGDTAAAAGYLGEQSTESIFRQAPETTAVMRGRVWLLRVAAILMAVAGLCMLSFPKTTRRFDTSFFKPVAITELDVRTFLAQLDPTHTNNQAALGWWQHGLFVGICLPPADLFPQERLPSIKAGILGYLASNTPANTPPEIQLGWALGASAFLQAAGSGFLTAEDLRPHRLDPTSVRAAVPRLPADLKMSLLGLQESQVLGHPCSGLTTGELALRIRFLTRSGCMDLVDLSPIVPTLLACQILSSNMPTGRCQMTPPESVHGLFQSRIAEFLRDTRDVLYLLDAAHALDRIDREACIAGILRFHRGKGLFIPDTLPGTNLVNLVRGDAPNTWFAFESLRMLGALDRVPDLAEWQFRSSLGDFETIKTRSGTTQVLTWPSLEAWCLQRRFTKTLAD